MMNGQQIKVVSFKQIANQNYFLQTDSDCDCDIHSDSYFILSLYI